MNAENARKLIEQHDDWRDAYLRNAHGADWDDPLLYDLTINTGRVSPGRPSNSSSASDVRASAKPIRTGRHPLLGRPPQLLLDGRHQFQRARHDGALLVRVQRRVVFRHAHVVFDVLYRIHADNRHVGLAHRVAQCSARSVAGTSPTAMTFIPITPMPRWRATAMLVETKSFQTTLTE